MKLSLTRKQELYLISLGLEQVLDNLGPKLKAKTPKSNGKNGTKWSKAHREKYAATMARKWGNKKK